MRGFVSGQKASPTSQLRRFLSSTFVRPPYSVNKRPPFANPIYNDHQNYPMGNEMSEMDHARPYSPILRPGDLKAALRREYDLTNHSSTPQLMTLPRFSGLLKGFRPGELSIFTGPTGSGKTTVLSQISLDLCMQGMRTMWGSFEVRNSRLAQVMIQQIATKPIILDHSDHRAIPNNSRIVNEEEATFEAAFDRLSTLPIVFMNSFGSTPLESVLECMELAVAKDGTQLIILDNLQFMLSGQSTNNFDKFDLVDQSIAAVRHFCNRHPVHVILVIHPRKEIDNSPLGLCSVSGTAKATQEADNVIVLQKYEKKRWLELKKNRFDGELGRVAVTFSRESRMVFEMDEKEEDEQVPVASSTTQQSTYPQRKLF